MTSSGRYLVPAIALAAVFYFLYTVHHVLLPFVLAATLAYVLNPVVSLFEGRGVRRRAAVLLVFCVCVVVLLCTVYTLVTMATIEASRIGSDWPRFVAKFKGASDLWQSLVVKYPFLHSASVPGGEAGLSSAERIWQHSPTLAQNVLPLFELTLLVPFLSLFFMLDGLAFRNALLELVPPRYVEMLLSVIVEIDHSLGNYIRGLCLQAFFLGLFTGIGFWVIGLHYAVPIACFVAATSMIPLVGPLSAGIVGCSVALVQWGTVAGVVKVALIAGGIRLLDDWFLHPFILRKAVHIHPCVTVFSLMAGGSLFGFWGLLFAVPAVCMAKVLFEVVWDWYQSEYGLRHDPLPVEVSQLPIV